MSKTQKRWIIGIFCSTIILLWLYISGLRIFALFYCIGAFLFSASSFVQTEVNIKRDVRSRSEITGKERKKRHWAGIMMIFSASFGFFTFYKVTPFIWSALFILTYGFILLRSSIKYLKARKDLPMVLRRVSGGISIENYAKAIDTFISIGNSKKAIAYAQEGLVEFPDSALLNVWQANAYFCCDKESEAIPFVRKALELKPDNELVKQARKHLTNMGYKIS